MSDHSPDQNDTKEEPSFYFDTVTKNPIPYINKSGGYKLLMRMGEQGGFGGITSSGFD